MKRIRVNGLQIAYESHGAGDPIVLVHGWGGLAQRARTVKSVRWGR